MSNPAVRPSALAGRWYPADAVALRRSITGFLAGADLRRAPAGRPMLAVVPHAGHAWSGDVAGRVFGLLRGRTYDRILLLAPNHRHYLEAPSVPHADAYATPLGEVPVDRAGRDALLTAGVVESRPAAHREEHAEEIQLPFLQVLWDDPPPVLPLLIPHLSETARRNLATALSPWTDGDALVLVSTDFTHYGASFGYVPFTENIPERLADLDGGAMDLLEARDPQGLLAYGARTGITMCGLEAAALALSLPWDPSLRLQRLAYARSGDRDGAYDPCVSYAGLLGAVSETP